jgi:hypothetical protein
VRRTFFCKTMVRLAARVPMQVPCQAHWAHQSFTVKLWCVKLWYNTRARTQKFYNLGSRARGAGSARPPRASPPVVGGAADRLL